MFLSFVDSELLDHTRVGQLRGKRRRNNPNWNICANIVLSAVGHLIKMQEITLQDIQEFIDEAPNGVILFTLGSAVRGSSLSKEKRQAFLSAFASIPQRVIWKYEESIENLPENIMTSSWLPQRDILGMTSLVLIYFDF